MSENRDNLKIDEIFDPVAKVSYSGVVINHNISFSTWFGEEKTMMDKNLCDIFQFDDWTKIINKLDKYSKYEFNLESKPVGFKRPIFIEVCLRPSKNKDFIYLHARDLSKVKEKELMVNSFAKIIENNNIKINKQKKQTEELLNNLKQAVFCIDDKLNVINPVSHYTRVLFGESFVGSNIFDTLFKGFDRNSEEYVRLQTSLATTFGEDEFQWELQEDGFPRKIIFCSPENNNQLILKANYTAIWDHHQELKKIMLVVEDLTDQEKLKNEIKNEKEQNNTNLEMIQQLSELDRGVIESFLRDAKRLLDEVNDEFLANASQFNLEQYLNNSFRILHTLKGNASSLNLIQLTTSIHHLENIVSKALKNKELNQENFEEYMRNVHIALGNYSLLAQRIFGIENEVLILAQHKIIQDILLLNNEGWLNEINIDVKHQLSSSKLEKLKILLKDLSPISMELQKMNC